MSEQPIEAYDGLYNESIPFQWWESVGVWTPTKFAYGSGLDGSGYMVNGENTTEAQANNAYCIITYLLAQGWQFEAICGLLGNIQSEGQTQPGKWESDAYGDTSKGFGLVQWTPATKYFNWALGEWGHEQWEPYYYSGWYECYRIAMECAQHVGGQWIPTPDFNISFIEFAEGRGLAAPTPEARVREAASAFLYNYERPSSYGSEQQRRQRAYEWYDRFELWFKESSKRYTKIKTTPQKPDMYFKLTDIKTGMPIWWYKVLYMAAHRNGGEKRYAR